MRRTKFIEKANVGLCMLLVVTAAYYLATFNFQAANLFKPKKVSASALSIENWWPSNGAQVQGVVPFKGLLKDTSVDQYNMYWKVDNGNLVSMPTNYTDYPHKEAMVDISNWNWKGKGPYTITFIAKNNSGEQLSESSFSIYNSGAQDSVAPTTVSPSPTTVKAETTSQLAQTVSTVQQVLPTITVLPSASVNVWWPADNVSMSGSQPFKAVVDGKNISEYAMYWQVDGGTFNQMQDSYNDYAHKEANVDITSWTWKGKGPYVLTFAAKNNAGQVIATKNITMYNSGASSQNTIAQIVQNASSAANPLSSLKLYVDPNSPAAQQASSWRSYRSYDASLMDKIAAQPIATWLGGWSGDITTATRNAVNKANAQGAIPVLIAYNIPARDCGSYSAGGANSPDGYRNWVNGIKNGIGNNKAVVILEPDALAGITCLSQNDQNTRYALIRDAVSALKSNGNTIVYIDAGNSSWISANDMASRLKNAGIDQANGFALNVSNFHTTTENQTYGDSVSKLVGNKHYIIDTSRNGNGANGEWCNPSGRALGQRPTTSTGNSLVDAYLWLKQPGESDGTCNGGPSAGTWWSDYALGLAQRASF